MTDSMSLNSRARTIRQDRNSLETGPRESSAEALQTVPRTKQVSVLVAAFLTICLTIGYNQSYGVFQQYYLSPTQDLLHPAPAALAEPPTGLLAFVGTLGAGITWAGSIAVNPLITRIERAAVRSGGPTMTIKYWPGKKLSLRVSASWITVSGVLLMSVGFMLASVSTTVWQLLLTQGFLYGVGSSLLYFPLLSPAPEYFTAHRATAMGFILSGAGVGGLVFSPVIRVLLSKVGAVWTLRILAISVALMGLPIALTVPKSRFSVSPVSHIDMDEEGLSSRQNLQRRTRIPLSLAKTPAFMLSTAAAFMQSAGAALPLSFIPSYSVALGLDPSTAATLLAVSNAVNAISRIATGYAGDRFGRQNTLIVAVLVSTVAVFGFWLGSAVHALPPLQSGHMTSDIMASIGGALWIAFVIIYSIAGGGYNALFPATIAEVFGIRQYAAVNGFIYFIRGCGTMVGSPVGGQLLGHRIEDDTGDGTGSGAGNVADYPKIIFWDGALLLTATVCVVGVRWADAKGKGWVWRA